MEDTDPDLVWFSVGCLVWFDLGGEELSIRGAARQELAISGFPALCTIRISLWPTQPPIGSQISDCSLPTILATAAW